MIFRELLLGPLEYASTVQVLPPGFVYQPDFLPVERERELIAHLDRIVWAQVRMHGVTAKRRVAHFGVDYAYQSRSANTGPSMPEFLLQVRGDLARWAALEPEALVEALVTEYSPGAPIGWHRDAPMFGVVVAVSLASACRMRFRRVSDPSGPKLEISLEPRSAYLMSGSARWQWQHHIPPAKELRYSITFRTLRGD